MRVIDLAFKDLRQIVKDPLSSFFLVVMPLLFTVFMGMAFSPENVAAPEDNRLHIGIVDRDGGVVAQQAVVLLEQSETARPMPSELDDLAAMEAAVQDQDLAAVWVLPAGLSDGWAEGDFTPALQLLVNPNSDVGRTAQGAIQVAAQRLQSAVQTARGASAAYAQAKPAATSEAVAAVYEEALQAAVVAWEAPPLSIKVEHSGQQEGDEPLVAAGFLQSSPGMLVQFALFGLIGAASLLVDERRTGTLQRLLTTTLSKAETIAGHVLAMFLLILFEQAVCVLAGQYLFGVNYFRQPGAVLLVMVGLALFSATLGLLISAIAKTEGQVIMIAMVAMMLLSAMGGAQFPLEITGEGFSRIGAMMPSYWAMRGFQNIILRGQGFASVLKPFAILCGAAVVVFGLAVWRFRFE